MESVRMPTSPPVPSPGDPQQRHPRSDNGPAQETRAESTVDISASVRAAMQQSVSYQIIRRTFAAENADSEREAAADGNAAPASAEAAGRQPPPRPADVAVAGRALEQVEIRTLQVESGDPPPGIRKGDPLLLDLDGDGAETTGMAGAVRFDLDADGVTDRVSFATGGDAFLALDRNGNGRIDSGRELFGDQDGAANGFEALRAHDANGDGRIDARDPVYERLLLVRAGAGGRLETFSLREAGIAAIGLAYRDVRFALNAYDEVAQAGAFTRRDGSHGSVVDVLVGYRPG